MDGLSSTIRKCNLQLKLDNNTEGYGNCFPNAVVQQCRRPEIKNWLMDNKPLAIVNSHQSLRRKVKNFALQSNYKTLHEYKKNYETVICNSRRTWKEYWDEMAEDGVWVDSIFVQVTAWFMGLDIRIFSTSSTREHPFILVTGDINSSFASSEGPSLLLGYYTNVHYQSLLPLSQENEERKKEREQNIEEDSISIKDDFIFMHNGEQLTFPKLDNNKLQCPFCNENFSRIASHVTSRQCNISKSIRDLKEFTSQLDSYKEGFRLEMARKRKQRSHAKLIEERGKDTVKKDQNERKMRSQAKLKEEKGKDTIKKEQNERKMKSQANIIEEKGKDTVKKEQNEKKIKSRVRKIMEEGEDSVKKEQNELKMKSQAKLIIDKGKENRGAMQN